MELKTIPMTDEYAAQYFHKNGYMWARLEILKEQETWGELRAKRIEKELREKIAQDIEAMICDPFNCPKYYPEVNIDECVRVAILLEQVARVARGTSNE
jgi:hypothetical protein